MKKMIFVLSAVILAAFTSCKKPTEDSVSSNMEDKVHQAGNPMKDAAVATKDVVKDKMSEDMHSMKDFVGNMPKFSSEEARKFVTDYSQYIKHFKATSLDRSKEKLAGFQNKAKEWSKKAQRISSKLNSEESKTFMSWFNKINEQISK